MDSTEVLTLDEVVCVVSDLRRKARRAPATNLIIFQLACGCGLRACEISGLNINDVNLDSAKPAVHVRKSIAKGGYKPRTVRLDWWAPGIMADLESWIFVRTTIHGAGPRDPLLLMKTGDRMLAKRVGSKWNTNMKCLSVGRQQQLRGGHTGRRTFATQALAHGRRLTEVRDALGHANISTTNAYLAAVERDLPPICPEG